MDLFDKKGTFENEFDEANQNVIPNNLSWDKMGPPILLGLEKRKKKRRFIWFFLLGVLICSMSVGSVVLWYNSNLDSDNSVIVSTNTLQLKTSDETVSKNKLGIKRVSSIHKSKESSISIYSSTQQEIKENSIEIEFTDNSKKKVFFNQNTLKEQENNSGIRKLNELELSNTNDKSNRFFQNKSASAINKIFETVNRGKENDFSSPELKSKLISNSKTQVARLPLHPIRIDSDYDLLELTHDTLSEGSGDQAIWSFSLTGGANLIYTNLQVSDAAPMTSEKSRLGWLTNLRLKRKINNRWSVQTGLELRQVSFKSHLQSSEEITLNRPNTLDTVFVSFQNRSIRTTYIDEVSGLRTRNFEHYNKYTSIKIPVLLGYKFQVRRLDLVLQTGPSFQLFRKNEGRSITHAGTYLDFDNKEIYAPSVQWSYMIESQFSYRINSKSKIEALFSFDHQLSNLFLDELSYQQRPIVFSSSFGISWNL